MALSMPIVASAQGGLFQRGEDPEGVRSSRESLLTNQAFGNSIGNGSLTNQNFNNSIGGGNNLTNQNFDNPIGGGSSLTNQTFGAPIGNGLFIMLMAGMGYATLTKKKKNNKNRKDNKQ